MTVPGAGAGWRTGVSAGELTAQLRALGVRPGQTLLVQASTRALGPVAGGSAGALAALRAAVGPTGTLVAYTATPENSDTSRLHARATAALDARELAAFRAAMPPFDRWTTPSSPTMGRLAEELRTTPGALRSGHPQTSFAALGPAAARLLDPHPLDCHLGERSPTGRLYAERAHALLIGVPLWCCTAYHLADYRVPKIPSKTYGCVVAGPDGRARWQHFEAPDLDDLHFPELAEAIRADLGERISGGPLGAAACFLVPIAPAVDAAAGWLNARAGALTG
ncbi:AAC(3) family N-acetyltransferase [Kitasatospora nipponensis]|uniref:Aminoglycoside N(3)-acetyltransferase n=1 Tax=Kitasatospora nipponensis TaxID=258049 RepID=A0ABP4GBQ8_9ACTN